MRTSGRFDPGWEEEHEPETKENKSRGRFETARLFPSRRISKTSGIGRKTDRYEKDCPKRFSMHFRTPPCGGSKIRRSWKPEEKIMQLQGGSIKTVQVGPFLSGGNSLCQIRCYTAVQSNLLSACHDVHKELFRHPRLLFLDSRLFRE